MNISEFINLPVLSTPIDWSHSSYMVNALREWLEAFTKAIKDLDDDALENKPDIQSKIAEGSRPLIESLEFYLNGKMLKAYERFENGIMHFKDSLIDLTKDSGDDPTKLSLFFRLRSSGEPRLSRRELFHIPFSQRHLVGTQRFSVTGTPCLYTAGSTYTCWEELGRPAFHELHVSALWLPSNQKLRLLDLRSTANAVRLQINNASFGKRDLTFEEGQKQLKSMICKCILIWPLIGFCSIRVKQRTGSFKPEYIIPQMVMQWIAARDEIDGVAYESTHINISTRRSIPFLSNYAFPARESRSNDVCDKLRQKFRMTEPLPWSLLLSINALAEAYSNYQLPIHPALISINDGSDFGKVENTLLSMAKHSVLDEHSDDDCRI